MEYHVHIGVPSLEVCTEIVLGGHPAQARAVDARRDLARNSKSIVEKKSAYDWFTRAVRNRDESRRVGKWSRGERGLDNCRACCELNEVKGWSQTYSEERRGNLGYPKRVTHWITHAHLFVDVDWHVENASKMERMRDFDSNVPHKIWMYIYRSGREPSAHETYKAALKRRARVSAGILFQYFLVVHDKKKISNNINDNSDETIPTAHSFVFTVEQQS